MSTTYDRIPIFRCISDKGLKKQKNGGKPTKYIHIYICIVKYVNQHELCRHLENDINIVEMLSNLSTKQ
jgi:hypothetical protein